MKKLCAVLLALVMVLSLTACDLGDVLSQVEDVLKNAETPQTESGEQTGEPEGDTTPSDTEPQSDTGGEQSGDNGDDTFGGLYETWHALVGYWNTNSEVYAVLDMADSHTAVFHYGWWETEFDSGEQTVTGLTASGDEEMTATLADGGVIVIDYSGLERDGKIRIKIGDEEWRQFARGGATAEEAYQTYCNDRSGN